ncbi:S9 family peptidase [soil metagenome]
MKRHYIFIFFLLLGCTAGFAQQSPYTIKDFFRNPLKSRYQISPDGLHLAYLAPIGNRMNIVVSKIGAKDSTVITKVKDRDISGYFWKNNTTLIYLKDLNGDENFHLFAADINGKNERDLTPFTGVRVNITDDLIDFPDEVLIETNQRNAEIFDVYRLKISTGEMKMVAENPGNISSWVTDHEGKVRVAVTNDGVNTSLLYRKSETDTFSVIITTNFKESCTPLFFTFDNKYLYSSSNIKRNYAAIVLIDPLNGQELKTIFEHPDVDVSDLSYSRKRKVITWAGYETEKYEYKFLDPSTEKMYKRLQTAFPEYKVTISSMNRDENKMIVRTYSDRSLGACYYYDLLKDSIALIGKISPWINENLMSYMKPITYMTRDGVTIHGYLTLPRGAIAKNLPLVINPHGGPWARDSWGWNPEVQFLASRGYAVLQMNFRGSTGYGKKFMEIGFKQWGQTMQNDITDGVKFLIDQGIADPKRVAIYGASYGGYATLAGITLTPDLYACAVDYVGVSNLFTFMKSIPPYWKPYLAMMYEMVGDPGNMEDSLMMRKTSPVFLVDQIKTPLFIAQGAQDPRVNKNESDQMVEALKKRNIDVEYMVKENEGHGFHNEENRFDFYDAMEKFLAKYLQKK